MKIRNNKHIEKLLKNNRDTFDANIGLTLRQIDWRFENTKSIMGLFVKSGLFGKDEQIILVKRSAGNFALFAPRNKKDKMPSHLYDIVDMGAFLKEHCVLVYEYDIDVDDLYEMLMNIKDIPAIGFVDIFDNKTFVYELS